MTRRIIIFVSITGLGFFIGNMSSSYLLSAKSASLAGFYRAQILSSEPVPANSPVVVSNPTPTQTPLIIKNSNSSISPDNKSEMFYQNGQIIVRDTISNTEKVIINTRLNVEDITWDKETSAAIRTTSQTKEIKLYRLHLDGRLDKI